MINRTQVSSWISGCRKIGLVWLALISSTTLAQEFPGLGPKGKLVGLEFEHGELTTLVGSNSRKQLIVTGLYDSGQRHDMTSVANYSAEPGGIVTISKSGLVAPATDGQVKITATTPEGGQATLELTVSQCEIELPVNFTDEVVPIFTKLGCNAGGCHGKADGQNGFKLSLLGFYPEDDYEYLVHEDRGRRIFPADPEFSLLLLKPANEMPHGGGKRMSRGTYEWELIARWIRQGMPEGSENDPKLERIEVIPPLREMNFDTHQQISVIGHYSDGSKRDVTRLTSFEPNMPEMAEVDSNGRVSVSSTPGEVAVMARFQGEVTVFRAILPQGLPVTHTPPVNNFIDELVFNRLKQLGIPPSGVCDDATFIRRATIDIAGRLPTLEETQTFMLSEDPQKRSLLVDRLVDSDDYANYFANKWSSVLRNKRRNNNDKPFTYRFHAWIRDSLKQNVSYDQFVRSILTAAGDVKTHPPVAWYREVATSTQQMEDTAQLFLGMRLACAKCHHHPFEQWSQQDYYGFEAFFTQVQMKSSKFNPQQNNRDVVFVRAIAPASQNPRTNQAVPPTGLGSEPLEISAYQDARHSLVDWMVNPENPFFSKALVNRYWKHFLGRGIVDPEDDLRSTNPPANPELLEALAQHFIDHQFDLKDLVRTICKSNVYQLSSEPTSENYRDKQNFSSFYARRLTAEVLYDAVDQVTGARSNFGDVPAGTAAVALPDTGFNNYFLQVFGRPEAESACECERSPEANLSQSLHLLNSNDIQGRLQNGQGFAAQLAADEEATLEKKVIDLYLTAFSRAPSGGEMAFVLDQLEKSDNPKQAFEDLIWAIINAKEFQFVR